MKTLISLLFVGYILSLPLFAQRFDIKSQGEKYGITDTRTNTLTVPPIYDDLRYSTDSSYFVALKGKKYGLISSTGKVIVPFKYSELTPCQYAPDYYFAGIKGNTFLINSKQSTRLTIDEYLEDMTYYDPVCTMPQGRIVRYRAGKQTGLLQFPDKVILPATYATIYPFQEVPEAYLLISGKNYRIYNSTTQQLSPVFRMKFDYMYFFFDNNRSYMDSTATFPCEIDGQWYLMKINGTRYPLEKMEQIEYNFDNYDVSMLLTRQNGKYGFMNRYGYILTDCIYDDLNWFANNDITAARLNGKYGYIDRNGQAVVPFIYDQLSLIKDFTHIDATLNGHTLKLDSYGNLSSDIIAELGENEKYGYSNGLENMNIDYIYDEAFDFAYHMGAAKKDGKWGFVAASGDTVIDFIYDDAKPFANQLAAVKKGGKWGAIDCFGNMAVPALYDTPPVFLSDEIEVLLNDTKVWINKKGEILEKP